MNKRCVVCVLAAALGACVATPQTAPSHGSPPSLLSLSQSQQLEIYKNIEATYAVRVAKRGSKTRPLPMAARQITPHVAWDGKTYTDVESFMSAARISGLLILRNGEIVLERYALGRRPEDRWTSFSVGKSVTSILLGMNPLVSYMRRLPREAEPGTKFVYKTGETDMAGILVANAVGKGLAQYLSEKLWKPYGMERDAIWMVDRGGMERGGCCISMTLRDYARVGLFMLEGGKAGRRQVLPAWYVREATTDQVKPPAQADYGYFWWGRGEDGYSAQGIFGQQIRIVPAEKLIVVINAAYPKATDRTLSQAQNAVLAAAREALD